MGIIGHCTKYKEKSGLKTMFFDQIQNTQQNKQVKTPPSLNHTVFREKLKKAASFNMRQPHYCLSLDKPKHKPMSITKTILRRSLIMGKLRSKALSWSEIETALERESETLGYDLT